MSLQGFRSGLLLAIVLLLSSGCGLAVRPTEEFLRDSDDYLQRLRWQDHNGVARYLIESERQAYLDRWSGQEDLRITDVNLDRMDFQNEGRQAQTRVTLEYYILPSTTIKKLRLPQSWEYLGGDRTHPGQWQIVTPFPPPPEP